MFTALNKGRLALGAVAVGAALALAGCASGDPLSSEPQASSSTGSETIVVGSQAYYSNEIIAEIYAQAIENAGLTVERKFQIGQRDAYLPALASGEVDVIPEYTGNLLQFYKPDATETKSDDVYKALASALPANLAVLDQATATDQDSYNVTAAYAEANNLTSIADLAKVQGVILGGNAELEERPYGPTGLQSVYGVNVTFSATGDTTVDALAAGTVNVANVYTADPRIQSQNLVTLTDPKGLFLASNVVPLVNKDLSSQLADILNPIDAKLTPEGLVELNVESVDQQRSSADIAKDWLSKNGFTS